MMRKATRADGALNADGQLPRLSGFSRPWRLPVITGAGAGNTKGKNTPHQTIFPTNPVAMTILSWYFENGQGIFEKISRGKDLMISTEMLDRVARLLLENSPSGSRIILFGSQARQTSTNESDVDFLVIEPVVQNRRAEMVRLRQIVRPLRVPVDVVVVSRVVFENWKEIPNTVLYNAFKEGKDYSIAA